MSPKKAREMRESGNAREFLNDVLVYMNPKKTILPLPKSERKRAK